MFLDDYYKINKEKRKKELQSKTSYGTNYRPVPTYVIQGFFISVFFGIN